MDKTDEEKLEGIMLDMKQREKFYNGMTKEELVNLLLMRDMLEDSFEPDVEETKLWYFTSDWTETKYLTNERPTKHIAYGKEIWTTDGEINIRVPACMETILPEIKYGDEPVKIRLSVSF